MRSDRDRLNDILSAIQKIGERTGAGREEFLRDEMLQVWMIHHLEIIGDGSRPFQ